MDKAVDWVIVGRFGRPHGIKGLITVHSFTEPRDNILHYTDWHAFIAKQWQPLNLLHVETNNKFILAQVDGYQERETAAKLTNVDIAICGTQLPVLESGDYYWHELIGMQVINEQGIDFGTVKEILATGANDVLVVDGERRRLIPYLLGQFVSHVDPAKQLITVHWDANF